MTYVRSYADWKNAPDTSTPITEAALDNMDAGVYAAHYDAVTQSTVSGATPLTLKGVTSQSAAYFKIQDVSSTELLSFSAAEKLTFRSDTTLYRWAADILKTDDSFVVGPAADTQARFKVVGASGNLEWGTGVTTADTNLYRTAADQLKTDDFFLAVQGLSTGPYTTTTRNAIGSGMAPNGLIILNTTTGQYEWNSGTDGARVWKPLGLDPTASLAQDGDITARSAAATQVKIGSVSSAAGISFGSANDVNITRTAANALESDSLVRVKRASSTDGTFASYVTGDSVSRHTVDTTGKHAWGPGSGAVDTELSRSAASTLSLGSDDKLVLGSGHIQFSDSSIQTNAVGKAVAATSLSSESLGGSAGVWTDYSSTAIACLVTIPETGTYKVTWGCTSTGFSANAHASGAEGLSVDNASPSYEQGVSTGGNVGHSQTIKVSLTAAQTLRLKHKDDNPASNRIGSMQRFIYAERIQA